MENQVVKTEQKSLTRISNQNYWQNWANTKVSVGTPAPELYRLNLPPLCLLEKPLENGVLVLQLVILEILDFIGAEWPKNQIQECSELVYREYYWFTIGELKQFSIRVKTGYFGKIYGKFAPMHLMEYFKDYSDEMFEARADYFGKKRPELEVKEEVPLTPEEEETQQRYFKSLSELTKRLCSPESEAATKEHKGRDERIKRHMEFFQAHMTDEQRAEIEQRRQEIQDAAKKYEDEKKS